MLPNSTKTLLFQSLNESQRNVVMMLKLYRDIMLNIHQWLQQLNQGAMKTVFRLAFWQSGTVIYLLQYFCNLNFLKTFSKETWLVYWASEGQNPLAWLQNPFPQAIRNDFLCMLPMRDTEQITVVEFHGQYRIFQLKYHVSTSMSVKVTNSYQHFLVKTRKSLDCSWQNFCSF